MEPWQITSDKATKTEIEERWKLFGFCEIITRIGQPQAMKSNNTDPDKIKPISSKRDRITELVCDYFDVPFEAILSRSLKENHSKARHMLMYLLRFRTDMSNQAVATYINRKNHATVLHGVSRTVSRMKVEKDLRLMVDRLTSIIDRENSESETKKP